MKRPFGALWLGAYINIMKYQANNEPSIILLGCSKEFDLSAPFPLKCWLSEAKA